MGTGRYAVEDDLNKTCFLSLLFNTDIDSEDSRLIAAQPRHLRPFFSLLLFFPAREIPPMRVEDLLNFLGIFSSLIARYSPLDSRSMADWQRFNVA
jgi:hypothetical protein